MAKGIIYIPGWR